MSQYKCDVCEDVIESTTLPSLCLGCGAEYSPWINLDTMKKKTAIRPTSTSAPKKPPIVIKKKSPTKSIISPYVPPPPITPYFPPYVPPPPPPPITPYFPPYVDSDLIIFLKEVMSAFGVIIQDIKNNIKSILIISLLIFIITVFLGKNSLPLYFLLLMIVIILLAGIVYIKSVKSFSISSVYKFYGTLGKIFIGLIILISLSLIQVIFIENISRQNNNQDSINLSQPNNSQNDLSTSSSIESSHSSDPRLRINTRESQITFTPFTDTRIFTVHDEETNIWNEISKFFRGIFYGSSLDQNGVYYVKIKINLKNSPSDKARTIDIIYPGERVYFMNEKEGNWLKAKTRNLVGWLNTKDSFYSTSSLNIKCTVSTNSLNVRSGPGNNYPIISRIKKNEIYKFIETNDQRTWCLIEDSNGNKGWVFFKLIDI